MRSHRCLPLLCPPLGEGLQDGELGRTAHRPGASCSFPGGLCPGAATLPTALGRNLPTRLVPGGLVVGTGSKGSLWIAELPAS